MATLPTLYPTSQVTAGGWTDESGGTSNLHLVIDEVGTPGTDYLRGALNAATSAGEFGVTDTPSDFGSMATLSVEVRHSRGSVEGGSAGAGNDTFVVYAQVKSSAGAALSDEVTVYSSTAGYAPRTDTISLTNLVASNKTTWDAAKVCVRSTFTKSGSNDGHYIWVDTVRLVSGTYNLALEEHSGSGSVSVSFSPSGSGVKAVSVSGTITVVFGPTSSATVAKSGSGSVPVGFSPGATVSTARSGSGSVDTAFAPAGSGAKGAAGAGSVGVVFGEPTAAGQKGAVGVGLVAVVLAPSSSGVKGAGQEAQIGVVFAPSGGGQKQVSGSGVVTVVFSPSASGSNPESEGSVPCVMLLWQT